MIGDLDTGAVSRHGAEVCLRIKEISWLESALASRAPRIKTPTRIAQMVDTFVIPPPPLAALCKRLPYSTHRVCDNDVNLAMGRSTYVKRIDPDRIGDVLELGRAEIVYLKGVNMLGAYLHDQTVALFAPLFSPERATPGSLQAAE
jgi:hypothetical protein